ncbi:MAG TPA: S8 family peptidase [Limnobacter sp.]|uniref:S8 family peptidase n=1 Tax=Limnobacter sp. TaxID=2003368 RepID=UPI002E3528E3|nr:S8 family peptidase [Limnobacter sp.]HEX5485545.1 S8 family peptidase [Limnobacter sp.]
MKFTKAFGIFLAFFALGAQANNTRLVIQFKQTDPHRQSVMQSKDLQNRLDEVAKGVGTPLPSLRRFGNHGSVVSIPSDQNVDQILQRLQSDPSVQSVALDRRIRIRAQSSIVGLLNALDLSHQARSWNLQDKSTQPASANVFPLFTNHHGTSPTVVAVLDTGVRFDHPMLLGHLLPGYDFVSDAFNGNDGQTTGASDRDADPTDPGDGVSVTDLAADPGCGSVSSSSWHGTFTAGMIAGNPIASEGVFPMDWNAVVEPVRVLGKCGGYTTDLADAIRWAAGLSVNGVPANPYPAKIINLSLGASGACVNAIEGQAVADARAAGALVVVAAGNNGGTVDTPANCPGALAVAGTDQQGLKANYSNFGSPVALTAPGGDSAYPMWGAGNTGIAGPLTNTYSAKIGTSFAAPQVSAALAMAHALNPSLSPDQLVSQLLATTRPFLSTSGYPACSTSSTGTFCNCTTATCGSGMLDVDQFIRRVSAAPLVNLYSNSGTVIPPGQSSQFSAQGSISSQGVVASSASFSISNVQKSDSTAPDPTLSVSGLDVNVMAPQGVQAFNLTATLGDGSSVTAPITVATAGSTSPTLLAGLLSPLLNNTDAISLVGATTGTNPAVGENSTTGGSNGGSGGGGGGGSSPALPGLAILAALLALYRYRSTYGEYK